MKKNKSKTLLKGRGWSLVYIYTPEDEEKAILPVLIFYDLRKELDGIGILFGWWHWGIRLAAIIDWNLEKKTGLDA